MENISHETLVTGAYEIKVHTPVGVEDGILHLSFKNDELSGSLENSRGTTAFTGGTVDGNELRFDTKIRTPMGRLKAHVTAKIENGEITGNARLPLGSATIEGKKQ
jgi:hypothetical protein